MVVVFADGRQFQCEGFSASELTGHAFVTISGVDACEAARIFSDSNCTIEMRYGSRSAFGYTVLESLKFVDESVQATLRRSE